MDTHNRTACKYRDEAETRRMCHNRLIVLMNDCVFFVSSDSHFSITSMERLGKRCHYKEIKIKSTQDKWTCSRINLIAKTAGKS